MPKSVNLPHWVAQRLLIIYWIILIKIDDAQLPVSASAYIDAVYGLREFGYTVEISFKGNKTTVIK